MVEGDVIDDGVGTDGGLTDQGGGAQHGNLGRMGSVSPPLPGFARERKAVRNFTQSPTRREP
jgi:hypothetical protein